MIDLEKIKKELRTDLLIALVKAEAYPSGKYDSIAVNIKNSLDILEIILEDKNKDEIIKQKSIRK